MTARFLAPRDDRMRMLFTGPQAKAALGGLVTNDVVALHPGQGQRAAALTVKGRVIAVLRVFDRGDDLLVDTEARAAEGFIGMIKKFVNPRLAKYTVVTAETGCLGVHGDGAAAAIVSTPGDVALLEALPVHGGMTTSVDGTAMFVARSLDQGASGFDVFGPRDRVEALRARLSAAGWPVASDTELEMRRVEVGLPRWGVDMNDETLAQEAALDALGAISFSKGCYTGQEVVARIHFRGHVNRLLRRLTSATALPVGGLVFDALGAEVGDVRSSVHSTTRGPLAIAMLRREVAPGAHVQVRAQVRAQVSVAHGAAPADAAAADAGTEASAPVDAVVEALA